MTFVRVCGKLDGHVVWATWEDGDLDGEPVLLETIRRRLDTGDEIPLADGLRVEASVADAWSFTAMVAALVDEPNVTGDDLPWVGRRAGSSQQPSAR